MWKLYFFSFRCLCLSTLQCSVWPHLLHSIASGLKADTNTNICTLSLLQAFFSPYSGPKTLAAMYCRIVTIWKVYGLTFCFLLPRTVSHCTFCSLVSDLQTVAAETFLVLLTTLSFMMTVKAISPWAQGRTAQTASLLSMSTPSMMTELLQNI